MLSQASYRRLPALATGRFKGHVRVYAIAYEYVAHTDSRFERDSLRQFVEAFQLSAQLTMREVWALPVVLRAVLLENLRRIASRTAASLAARERADQCVDRPRDRKGAGRCARRAARAAADAGAGSLCRPARAAVAGPVAGIRDDPARNPGSARAPGDQRRGDRAVRAHAPRREQRHRSQHHHQPARALLARLARVLRVGLRCRRHTRRTSVLPRNRLQDAGSLPACDRGARSGVWPPGGRRCGARTRSRADRRAKRRIGRR